MGSLKAEASSKTVGVHTLSPGMVLTNLLLEGATLENKQIFNILCEQVSGCTSHHFLLKQRVSRFHTLIDLDMAELAPGLSLQSVMRLNFRPQDICCASHTPAVASTAEPLLPSTDRDRFPVCNKVSSK